MPRTKTFTEDELKQRQNKSVQKTLTNNYKQFRVNVKKSIYYEWEQYAKSKGMSMYALLHQFFSEAMEKDGFTPDIPYSEIENSDQ